MSDIPKQTLDILEHLLGGLINDKESQIALMKSDIISSVMVPEQLKFHKAVLEGIERCDEKNMIPNVDNVTLLSMSNDPEMHQKVEALSKLEGVKGMVHANAIWWKGWAEQVLLAKAASKIAAISKMDYSDAKEKQSMMMDEIIKVPIAHTTQSFTRIELLEMFEEEQAKRVKRKEKGQALGGILHLHGLREVIPVLESSDLTLITAPTKAGKTMLGMILAEMNSVNNDCDVLWLLLETSPKTIEERFLAKNLLIPGKRLKDGSVDFSKEPFKSHKQKYNEQENDYWNHLGRVYLQYVAGERLSAIEAQIRIHKRMADIRNRPLIVIIDYLQRIPKSATKTETEALASIANTIKDMAVKYNCHIVLFSQESFSAEGRQKGDSRAHGSNTPIFVAQIHMALRVLKSEMDVLVGDGKGGIAKDLCDGDRFWQKEGKNKRQSVVRFDIMRANNDETGQAYAAFEGGMFRMEDLSIPDIKMPKFMRDQIESFEVDLKNPSRQLI